MGLNQRTIIESIGSYIPSGSVSTQDIMMGCRNKIGFPLEKLTGIKTRPIAGDNEYSINLAEKAVMDCLDHSAFLPEDIDLIICCNISRYDGSDYLSFEPCTAIQLKEKFSFTRAIAFDITNACAGIFTGIYIVDSMIKSGAIKRGLVVSGEYISHLTKSAQQELESVLDSRMACLTLGDSGVAMTLCESNNEYGFDFIDLKTYGHFSKYCIAVPAQTCGMIMHTDAVNLTDVGIKSGAEHTLESLKRAGWSYDGFSQVVMHQTSRLTLNSASREINKRLDANVCHDGNTVNNLENRGNTSSTSHFIAVADLIRQGKIRRGDRYVFSITASGLTIGTALYRFDDLPGRLNYQQQPKDLLSRDDIQTSDVPTSQKAGNLTVGIESSASLEEQATSPDTFEMAKAVAQKCLSRSKYETCDIDLLIFTGVYRSGYIFEPACAALLAGALDMNGTPDGDAKGKTFAFDIFNGATGTLNAISVASEFINAGVCKTAMIVAAEVENNTKPGQVTKVGVSETASAIILESSPKSTSGFRAIDFYYYTEAKDLYRTYAELVENYPVMRIKVEAGYLDACMESIVKASKEFTEANKLRIEDFDLVIPPQISSDFVSRLCKELNISSEKCVNVTSCDKDLFTSSIITAFEGVFEKGLAHPGKRCLVITVGSGVQVGFAVYRF